jgi:flavin reductase (DIM6/NTAB) family NADH-FMN oxidoreductase RutF
VNLAPFSFFNLLSYDPPFVMFSAGTHERDGGPKDTVANVEATREFVYNMATWAQREAMNQTASIVERGVDELRAAGLEACPSRLVRPAACSGFARALRVPPARDRDAAGPYAGREHSLVIGRVVAVHIDDAALTQTVASM